MGYGGGYVYYADRDAGKCGTKIRSLVRGYTAVVDSLDRRELAGDEDYARKIREARGSITRLAAMEAEMRDVVHSLTRHIRGLDLATDQAAAAR
jgi:hypothetical protein